MEEHTIAIVGVPVGCAIARDGDRRLDVRAKRVLPTGVVVRKRTAGVVHENVEASQPLHRFAHHPLYVGGNGDVSDDSHRPHARRCDLALRGS